LESTLTASLLQPEVWRYEIMPWPDRVFKQSAPGAGRCRRRRARGIPKSYETELQTVITRWGT